jgi:hypothetical protein
MLVGEEKSWRRYFRGLRDTEWENSSELLLNHNISLLNRALSNKFNPREVEPLDVCNKDNNFTQCSR